MGADRLCGELQRQRVAAELADEGPGELHVWHALEAQQLLRGGGIEVAECQLLGLYGKLSCRRSARGDDAQERELPLQPGQQLR